MSNLAGGLVMVGLGVGLFVAWHSGALSTLLAELGDAIRAGGQ